MPKMNKKDIVKEINVMIANDTAFIEEIKNSSNPQTVALKIRAEGRIHALEDVLFFANKTKR